MTTHRCDDFDALWHRALDRDRPLAALSPPEDCDRCRAKVTFARLLATPCVPPVTVPLPRTVTIELPKRRGADRTVLAVAGALAAAVLVTLSAVAPPRPEPARPEVAVVVPRPAPAVPNLALGEYLAGVRVSIGTFPKIDAPAVPVALARTPELPGELAGLPAAAKSGVEPITGSTLKAWDYFRGQVRLAPREKL